MTDSRIEDGYWSSVKKFFTLLVGGYEKAYPIKTVDEIISLRKVNRKLKSITKKKNFSPTHGLVFIEALVSHVVTCLDDGKPNLFLYISTLKLDKSLYSENTILCIERLLNSDVDVRIIYKEKSDLISSLEKKYSNSLFHTNDIAFKNLIVSSDSYTEETSQKYEDGKLTEHKAKFVFDTVFNETEEGDRINLKRIFISKIERMKNQKSKPI